MYDGIDGKERKRGRRSLRDASSLIQSRLNYCLLISSVNRRREMDFLYECLKNMKIHQVELGKASGGWPLLTPFTHSLTHTYTYISQ